MRDYPRIQETRTPLANKYCCQYLYISCALAIFAEQLAIRGTHRRLAKKRFQCLNEVLCFVSSSVLADSLVLRNPLLRQAPKRLPASVKKQHKQDFRVKIIKNNFYFACNYKIKTTFAGN
jgi:hypothetical protein